MKTLKTMGSGYERLRLTLRLTGVVAAIAVPSLFAETPAAGHDLTRRDRLEAATTVMNKEGKPLPVNGTLRHWIIPGKRTVEISEPGFLLVELRGGKVSTVIDGKEEKRVPGDFWTVPAKGKMTIQVTGESAGLDVLSVTMK